MNDQRDRGALGIALALVVVVALGGAGLVVDGGRAMAARRHAAGTAEAAARSAVTRLSLRTGFDADVAEATARSYAQRAGIAPADVDVDIVTGPTGTPQVNVTIIERRTAVFLALASVDEITVRASGSAIVVWSS
jgi:Flp pilus assembly protein TadG